MKTPRDIETKTQKGFAVNVLSRLAKMDRTEELCLVTAALCAFGSALAAQKRTT